MEENAFDAARSEESAARARSHGAGNLYGHVTATANEIEEEKEEKNTAGNCKQPARNPVRGGYGWVNENAPMSAPLTLGIPWGADRSLTKQETVFPAEVNAPRTGTAAQELNGVLMGGNRMLKNTVGRGYGMGGATGTAAAPTVGQQQGAGRGGT